MYKGAHGFTIVELLVVIVVIAILSAIIIVTYKGISDRAEAARASAAVNAYVKLLKIHQSTTGDMPSTEDSPSWEYCLGKTSDFPADGVFGAGECLYNPSGPYIVSVSDTLNDTLTIYGEASNTRLPNAVLGPETWRGIRYSYVPGTSSVARIEWVVNGSVSCAPGTGSPGTWWGSTWCTLDIEP